MGKVLTSLIGPVGIETKNRGKSLAWSPDSKFLSIASTNGTANVWRIKTGKVTSNIPVGKAVKSVSWWSPNDNNEPGKKQLLATGSVDRNVKVWNPNTGQPIVTLQDHCDYYLPCGITSVAWSPDGKWLATGSTDHTAKIWFMGKEN
jgi:WD40 repeat protein